MRNCNILELTPEHLPYFSCISTLQRDMAHERSLFQYVSRTFYFDTANNTTTWIFIAHVK
jgi:hypothetical protein